MTTVADAYSRRAEECADLLGTMDAVHPSDRQLIDSWATTVSGRALDTGWGPGNWTSYLTAHSLDIYGIDLVPSSPEHAGSTYPGATFQLDSIDNVRESRSSRAPSGPVASSCSGTSTAPESSPSITPSPAHIDGPLPN